MEEIVLIISFYSQLFITPIIYFPFSFTFIIIHLLLYYNIHHFIYIYGIDDDDGCTYIQYIKFDDVFRRFQ